MIKKCLNTEFKKSNMNISGLAEKLGISRGTLINKIEKLGMAELYKERKKLNAMVTFVNKVTNEKRFFQNIREAADKTGYEYKTIRYALYTGCNIGGCKVKRGAI